jgi:hypothetical protein
VLAAPSAPAAHVKVPPDHATVPIPIPDKGQHNTNEMTKAGYQLIRATKGTPDQPALQPSLAVPVSPQRAVLLTNASAKLPVIEEGHVACNRLAVNMECQSVDPVQQSSCKLKRLSSTEDAAHKSTADAKVPIKPAAGGHVSDGKGTGTNKQEDAAHKSTADAKVPGKPAAGGQVSNDKGKGTNNQEDAAHKSNADAKVPGKPAAGGQVSNAKGNGANNQDHAAHKSNADAKVPGKPTAGGQVNNPKGKGGKQPGPCCSQIQC